MSPIATIVVPLLRQKDSYLEQCVLSALTQSVRPEVVVVTSARTPASNLAILERFARQNDNLRVVQRERDTFAAGVNTAFAAARGRHVGLLMSDDWLANTAVEACLDQRADIVSTNMAIFSADGCTRLHIRPRRTAAAFERMTSLHDKASYIGHFLMITRDAVLAAGGVDETIGLTGPDDFDLVWTLLERGASVSLVEDELYNYRDHPGERLTLRRAEDQLRDLERILDKHHLTGEDRQRAIEKHSRWFGKTLLAVARELEAKSK